MIALGSKISPLLTLEKSPRCWHRCFSLCTKLQRPTSPLDESEYVADVQRKLDDLKQIDQRELSDVSLYSQFAAKRLEDQARPAFNYDRALRNSGKHDYICTTKLKQMDEVQNSWYWAIIGLRNVSNHCKDLTTEPYPDWPPPRPQAPSDDELSDMARMQESEYNLLGNRLNRFEQSLEVMEQAAIALEKHGSRAMVQAFREGIARIERAESGVEVLPFEAKSRPDISTVAAARGEEMDSPASSPSSYWEEMDDAIKDDLRV